MAKVELETVRKGVLGKLRACIWSVYRGQNGPTRLVWVPCGPAFRVPPDLFGQFLDGVLGSSLSSGTARKRLRIRHEGFENGIADAPLEASQRLLTGLALRNLLAVVDGYSLLKKSAPSRK
jgi:hypothetical protein